MLQCLCIILTKDVVLLNKKRLSVILGAAVITVVSTVGIISVSAFDTQNDPLITLSYLHDVVLPEFKRDILATIGLAQQEAPQESQDAASENIDAPQDSVPAAATQASDAQSADGNGASGENQGIYELLELSYGQTVMADSICEFIIRPGSIVTCISPFPAQGAADITNGIEVLDGEEFSINAYCLIPRGSDGRGLRVNSEKAYIMIRGEYTIG